MAVMKKKSNLSRLSGADKCQKGVHFCRFKWRERGKRQKKKPQKMKVGHFGK